MDIHNIAMVRATNAIPFDGKVHPVKDTTFIKKENSTPFQGEFFSLLRRKGVLHPIDWETPEEERITVEEKNKQIVAEYMPYTSMYNSMVLWSLNGLVPDDAFNKFSQKTCAIVDGLEEQVEQSEIISIMPTDTALKETVTLSKNATLLIAKQRYEQLSQQQKEQLEQLNFTVSIFEGDLKTAIDTILIQSGRYTAETLDLVSEGGGYKESATSKDVIDTINSVAKERAIPQILHDKIFRGETEGVEKLEDVKGEKQQCDIIAEVYKQTFFDYLFSRMNIDENVKMKSQYNPNSDIYMEELCDEIGRIGIDKYKQVVDEYNKSLEELRDIGRLPTPQQIVDAVREDKKIDLISMIEQVQNQDAVLTGAIEATETVTTTRDIKEQEGKLSQIEKEIQETEIK